MPALRKPVSARRRNQHARRVRYPGAAFRADSLRAFFERGGFAAQVRENFAGEMQ